MPSRPNYLLFLAIACSLPFVVSTEATAFQTEVTANFPTRVREAIDKDNKTTSRSRINPESPIPDAATAGQSLSTSKSISRLDYTPPRQRIKASPVGSNAYNNPLRKSRPFPQANSATMPRLQERTFQDSPRSQWSPLPESANYKQPFGTVMTFPASSPVPYQAVAPKTNPATSFSFGDSRPMPKQLGGSARSPMMLQRQFELQQHVFDQQRQIEQLKQQVQSQSNLSMTPPPIPPSVASQTFGDNGSPDGTLGESQDKTPAQQVSAPISRNFSSPADTKIIPSSALPVELATSVIGPEALVEGAPDEFEIIVTNSGDLPATDVIVQISVPDDITVSRLDREAWLDDKKRTVSWKIPEILGREREVIRYSAVSKAPGRYGQRVVIGMGSNLKGDTTFETVVISEEEFKRTNSTSAIQE